MINQLQDDLNNIIGSNINKPDYMTALDFLNEKIEWREVEVQLPLLNTTALMQPLIGEEDLKLKSLRSSGATYVKTLDEILFKSAKFKNVKFKDIDDFISHIGMADKSMLVYGLLCATFSEDNDTEIKCPHCETIQVKSTNIIDLQQPDTLTEIWDEKYPFFEYRKKINIMDGFDLELGFPTDDTKIKLYEYLGNAQLRNNIKEEGMTLTTLDLAIILIKKIIITKPDGSIQELVDPIEEIRPLIFGLKSLQLKKKIINIIKDEKIFTKFHPKFYNKFTCSNGDCGKEITWVVDPELEFFRQALSIYDI